MNRRKLLLGAAALAACAPAANGAAPAPFPMRRGVNLGNALEAPHEGDWGYRIEASHLTAIAAAGFDGVRLPVRWDGAVNRGLGALPVGRLDRVREVCAQALGAGLMVQLDLHHYDALIAAGPRSALRGNFLAIWRHIAEAFHDAPDRLIFEPLNEPVGPDWTGAALRDFQAEVVGLIRETNPRRLIVLGPSHWQNIDALSEWAPPPGENIAVSVHYYEPHAFTHQNAEWLGPNAPVYGRTWGTDADRAQVREHMRTAADWARRRGYAMQLGEFGANRAVALQQRAAWTGCVREACEAEGMGWCAWDFAGAFPVWDGRAFIPEMLSALIN